jgi:hypothetical protein
MRVCIASPDGSGTTDVDGNLCNWTACSFGNAPTGRNDYMGGCAGNSTAGTLCCKTSVVVPPPVFTVAAPPEPVPNP